MITADDLVEDVVSKYPKTVRIFMNHNFPCLVCGEAVWGSIGENAARYHMPEEKLEQLIRELNESVKHQDVDPGEDTEASSGGCQWNP